MIQIFHRSKGQWQVSSWAPAEIPPRDIWIDLISPSTEEIAKVQTHLKIEIPSRAEMWPKRAPERRLS